MAMFLGSDPEKFFKEGKERREQRKIETAGFQEVEDRGGDAPFEAEFAGKTFKRDTQIVSKENALKKEGELQSKGYETKIVVFGDARTFAIYKFKPPKAKSASRNPFRRRKF